MNKLVEDTVELTRRLTEFAMKYARSCTLHHRGTLQVSCESVV